MYILVHANIFFKTRKLMKAFSYKIQYSHIHFIISSHFISIFIFLTHRKAQYTRQAITPTCFRRCHDIAFRLKCFICFLFSFLEIQLRFRTACRDHQVKKSFVKCLSQGRNRTARVGFEPRPCRSQSRRS